MPPIMMFHPNLARLMINSRIRVLDTAKENAKGTGYLGARFPWEQAVTGIYKKLNISKKTFYSLDI